MIIIIVLMFMYIDHREEKRILNNEEPSVYENREDASNYKGAEGYNDPFQFSNVGDVLEFEFMTVNNDDVYKIGYNGQDDLEWMGIGKKTDTFKIKVTNDIEKNYIERINNEVKRIKIEDKYYYKAYAKKYVIYIKPNSMNGGETIEDCGKYCEREIETEVVR